MESKDSRIKKLNRRLNRAMPQDQAHISKETFKTLTRLRQTLQLLFQRVKEKINSLYKERNALHQQLKQKILKLEEQMTVGDNFNRIEQNYLNLKTQIQHFGETTLQSDINSEFLTEDLLFKINLRMERDPSCCSEEEQKIEKPEEMRSHLSYKIRKLDQGVFRVEENANIDELIAMRLSSFPQASLELAQSIREFAQNEERKQRRLNHQKLVFKLVNHLAQKGSLEAKRELASLYLVGDGVERNVAHAIEMLKQLISVSCSAACMDLARIYLQGAGVPKNEMKAISFLQKAEALGEEEPFKILAP